MHVSDRFPVYYQESSTVYTAIGVCHTGYADYLLTSGLTTTNSSAITMLQR